MKMYVVTYVEYGENCDGKARILCTSPYRAEAFIRMNVDMCFWYDKYKKEGVEMDFDKMSAHFVYDSDKGCEWNIEEVEI